MFTFIGPARSRDNASRHRDAFTLHPIEASSPYQLEAVTHRP